MFVRFTYVDLLPSICDGGRQIKRALTGWISEVIYIHASTCGHRDCQQYEKEHRQVLGTEHGHAGTRVAISRREERRRQACPVCRGAALRRARQ